MSEVGSLDKAFSKANPKIVIKLRIKNVKVAEQPHVPRRRLRQVRIRDCQRALPAHLKLDAVKYIPSGDPSAPHVPAVYQLPNPFLLQVYSHLVHPRHQLAFALVCHQFAAAAAASLLPLRSVAVWRGGTKYWYGKEHALIDLKKWGWIPEGLKLCRSCVKYLPHNRIWKRGDGRELRRLKKVDWMWSVGKWLNGGNICPACQIENAHDLKEEIVQGEESWVQCWGEGFVQNVMVKRKFADDDDGILQRKRTESGS